MVPVSSRYDVGTKVNERKGRVRTKSEEVLFGNEKLKSYIKMSA